MKTNITTSVVMATYNGERNIIEQVDSLKNQTKAIDEVIICDDGSTDRTVEIIQEYINSNHLKHWKLIVNAVNKGWRQNFIDLLNEASGEYIFPCDQDDIWYDNKIEKMSTTMYRNSNIAVLVSNYTELIEEGGHSSTLRSLKTKKDNLDQQVVFTSENVILKRPGCVYAVRKDFVSEVTDYFNQALNSAHDISLWGSALAFDRLYLLDEPTIVFRRHGESSFKKETNEARKNSNYQYRINMLNRYNERLNSLNDYIIEENGIKNKQKKEEIIQRMMKINANRASLLEKRSVTKIIFSFSKYEKPFDYFADIYHVLKLRLGK
ncbi:glycosyltransferase [Enterococcus plantarum]|uniref:Glycosyl transferase n=1 Tax=Enterococcus plantarum TaxID=1077675 RepID=A0A2W4BEJ1_9ENTE|nr:glycosyltransferase [Enterococcus plantarum]MBO0468648.1 glycosyltransferase [Enterococcus plantarum]PZL70279.1 glycosyl transferase [Enterococcus plantarum]